ncbi:MAG: DUF4349 domain-containing protein [Clostridiaceae bacterium]|nr:DUF4349 domain-containing protein [Clostridiaceae bacterium]
MKNYSGKIKFPNKTKKISIFLSLFFILSIALSVMGCGSSARKDVANLGNYEYKSEAPMEAYDNEYKYDGFAEESYTKEGVVEETLLSSQGTGAKEAEPNQRKLIKNGNIELRCDDVEVSYQNVLELVKKYEGFATNLNRNETDTMLRINADFGIPADELDQFVDEISETEIVNYIKINAEDITDNYYDATIRLDTAEKSLEKYYEFLLNAKKIEDMVYIQGEIDRLTEEIEILKGSIKRWDSQVDYSYVSIEFLQKQAQISGKREIKFSSMTWDDFKYWVSSGWNSVIGAIISFFQWLAIAILVSAPVIIPLILIIIIILIIYRKRKKARSQQKQQQAERTTFVAENPGAVEYKQSLYQDMYQGNQQYLDQNINQSLNQEFEQNTGQNNQETEHKENQN